mmetsp:Transcript_85958/g.248200  ORF Transcript_85958/g.248200 Transcript_85958/m.248200 type:complete len:317 (-) Transcript_85958:1472-2422(-)
MVPQTSCGGSHSLLRPTCWSGRKSGLPLETKRSGMRKSCPCACASSSPTVKTNSSSIKPGKSLKQVSVTTVLPNGCSQSDAGSTFTAQPRPCCNATAPCARSSFCCANSAPIELRKACLSCLSSSRKRFRLPVSLLRDRALGSNLLPARCPPTPLVRPPRELMLLSFFLAAAASLANCLPCPAGCGSLWKEIVATELSNDFPRLGASNLDGTRDVDSNLERLLDVESRSPVLVGDGGSQAGFLSTDSAQGVAIPLRLYKTSWTDFDFCSSTTPKSTTGADFGALPAVTMCETAELPAMSRGWCTISGGNSPAGATA